MDCMRVVPALAKYVLRKNCPLVLLFQKDMSQECLEEVVLELVRTPEEVRSVRAIISALRRWTTDLERQDEYPGRPDDRGSDCTGVHSDLEMEAADPEAESDMAEVDRASSGGSVCEVVEEKEKDAQASSVEKGTSDGSSKRYVSNQAVKARSTTMIFFFLFFFKENNGFY